MFTKVVMGVAAFVTFFAIYLFFNLSGMNQSTAGFWICLLVSIGAACLVAWIISWEKVWKFIFFILGAIAGFYIGLLLDTVLLAIIGSGPAWLFLAFGIIFGIIGAFYAYKNRCGIVILGTSVIGSYWIIRGLSYFYGNFPNEIAIWEALNNGLPLSEYLNDWFWIYFGIFIVSAVIGIWWQINDDHCDPRLENDKQFKEHKV